MTSYIQLLNKIEAFCLAHKQIQKYGGEFREQMPNFSTKDTKYPMVFVSPSNGAPLYDTNEITLDIYCVDIIQKGRENLNTIVSDCHLILTDLYIYFSQGSDLTIDVLGTPSQTPLNNLDLDYVAGWMMTITFQVEGWCVAAIPMGDIPSGQGCEDATYIVEYEDGTPIETGTIASGATKTIEVPNCPACDSANWTLLDTDGNVLDSGTIPSGGSANITAPDGHVHIKKENDGTIANVFVLSGGTEDYIVNNNDISVNGVLEFDIHATDALDIRLRNTDNDVLTPASVTHAGSHATIVLPDSQINVNGVDEGDVVSVKTIDVNITDGTNPVTPDAVSLVGNTLTIEVPAGGVAPVGAMPLKTGQTISYATDDDGDIERGRPLFTLPVVNSVQTLNHFGHKWALTGVTGGYYDYDTSQYKDVNGTVTTRGLAFPNYLLCDFRSQDVNGNFFLWSLSSSWIGVGGLDFTTAKTTADALTVGGFSGFKVPNFNEIMFSFWMNNNNMIAPIEAAYPNTPPTVVFNSNSTDTLNTANNIGFWIGGPNRKILIYFPKAATNPIVNYCFLRITNISEL